MYEYHKLCQCELFDARACWSMLLGELSISNRMFDVQGIMTESLMRRSGILASKRRHGVRVGTLFFRLDERAEGWLR